MATKGKRDKMGKLLDKKLIIRFKDKDDKEICNAYYPCISQTYEAMKLCSFMMQMFKKINKEYESDMLIALGLLEETGACLTNFAQHYLNNKLKISRERFTKHNFLNSPREGFISISPQGIKESHKYENNEIIIYLKDNTIDFDVLDV